MRVCRVRYLLLMRSILNGITVQMNHTLNEKRAVLSNYFFSYALYSSLSIKKSCTLNLLENDFPDL